MKTELYKKSIVTYLDILGFHNIVKESSDVEILNILKNFRHYSNPDMPNIPKDEEAGRKFINFSDTSVRTTEILSPSNLKCPSGLLFYEVHDLIYIQVNLINKGFFVRGALVIGDIYHEDGIVFGPALNQAHALETDVAIFPRIIVAPEALMELKTCSLLWARDHDFETELEYVKPFLHKSSDGVWSIDYLAGLASEADSDHQHRQFLLKHQALIQKMISTQHGLNRIRQKYEWLAEYHNNAIRTRPKQFWDAWGMTPDRLMIDCDERLKPFEALNISGRENEV